MPSTLSRPAPSKDEYMTVQPATSDDVAGSG
jgi:hypothetical protein